MLESFVAITVEFSLSLYVCPVPCSSCGNQQPLVAKVAIMNHCLSVIIACESDIACSVVHARADPVATGKPVGRVVNGGY